ncbi:MAG: hypothetical protein M1821_000617 [Bathelium mastoideum]|nr:MAG: hypothetical protein M1821_000617 [Bathelium mastoideum]
MARETPEPAEEQYDTPDSDSPTEETPLAEHFSPEEEATLLEESNTHKSAANTQFGHGHYTDALSTYDKALAVCPAYLDYELAVLRSNVAACQLKLQEWQAAVTAAEQSLANLERLDPLPKPPSEDNLEDGERGRAGQGREDKTGTEVVEEVDDQTAARIEALAKSGRTRADVQRIRIKALLRRARAQTEIGSWATLQSAEEDYKQLAGMAELQATDRKSVERALRELAPRLEEAKGREMGEMMGKLKELGNGILKPFGLSTDNFQFTKDEKSGGYSMNFNQNR